MKFQEIEERKEINMSYEPDLENMEYNDRVAAFTVPSDSVQTVFSDNINHPAHYCKGIECAAYIASHDMDFFQGNAVKYLTRFKHKGTALEDLKKARWYLDRLIEKENLKKGTI